MSCLLVVVIIVFDYKTKIFSPVEDMYIPPSFWAAARRVPLPSLVIDVQYDGDDGAGDGADVTIHCLPPRNANIMWN